LLQCDRGRVDRENVGRCRFRVALIAAALFALSAPASAQIDSLSVSLLPAAVSFTLTPNSATNAGSVAIAATTTWSLLLPTRTAVKLYGYFSSASSALVHTAPTNTVNIPSSRVQVSVNGGASGSFDQTVVFGAANAGRLLATQAITVFTLSGNRTDTLTLNIDLNGYSLPADTYVGTLRIRAQATP
jgi:hypothetical protein